MCSSDQSVQSPAVQLVKHATQQNTGSVNMWKITSSFAFFPPTLKLVVRVVCQEKHDFLQKTSAYDIF